MKLTHAILLVFLLAYSEGSKVMMCYVSYWSIYRDNEGKFDMGRIEPHLCSHIIYISTELNSSWTIQSSDSWADKSNLRKLIGLKRKNNDLKILTKIGGWSQGSAMFSNMTANHQHRSTFRASVLQYLKVTKLDGLDVDWQYPTKRGGVPQDVESFVTLLQELRTDFDQHNYTLTVRLMGSTYAVEGYDLPRISKAVHFINLRSFSYHGIWESETFPSSPLTSSDDDNVEASINLFLDEGVDRSKLLVGLSTEGTAYVTTETLTPGHTFGIPFKEGFSGPWLDELGVLGFNEICWKLVNGTGWKEFWDEASSTPYTIKGNKLSSFDNVDSMKLKVELVHKEGLAGISFHSLDTDDFRGICYDEPFILTASVSRSLFKPDVQSVTFNQEYS